MSHLFKRKKERMKDTEHLTELEQYMKLICTVCYHCGFLAFEHIFCRDCEKLLSFRNIQDCLTKLDSWSAYAHTKPCTLSYHSCRNLLVSGCTFYSITEVVLKWNTCILDMNARPQLVNTSILTISEICYVHIVVSLFVFQVF